MKFNSSLAAKMYAKLQTIQTHKKHIVVMTQYFDMTTFSYVPSYTVILQGK